MANARINLPNSFIDKLEGVSRNLDVYAKEALEAGADVVEPVMRANLKASIGAGTVRESRSTGQLLSALGVSPVKAREDGKHDVKVGFAETRDDGANNALIANVLEYGRSNQEARPFLAPTRVRTRKRAIEAMKHALSARLGKPKP